MQHCIAVRNKPVSLHIAGYKECRRRHLQHQKGGVRCALNTLHGMQGRARAEPAPIDEPSRLMFSIA